MSGLSDPLPAAARPAKAWRSGALLTELPPALRPQTLAQGYDADLVATARERGAVLPRGSIVSTGTVSKPVNVTAHPAEISARFSGAELGLRTKVG